MKNIIALSGGKDSTAMLLLLIEREPIHSIVFFDTGWEFPEMYDHINKLEKYINIKIWKLHSPLPFDYWALARPVISKKTKQVERIGCGWPSAYRRWCTRIKGQVLSSYMKPIKDGIFCVGYAYDEENRKFTGKYPARFPLQELGITEKEALKICMKAGFDWGGLYNIFNRVSCYCCPLQSLDSLRKLRSQKPVLWGKMLLFDSKIQNNVGFGHDKTLNQLELRFQRECITKHST